MFRLPSAVTCELLPFFVGRRVCANGSIARVVKQSLRSLASQSVQKDLAVPGKTALRVPMRMLTDDINYVHLSGLHKTVTIAGLPVVSTRSKLSVKELQYLMNEIDGFFLPVEMQNTNIINRVSRITQVKRDYVAASLFSIMFGSFSVASCFLWLENPDMSMPIFIVSSLICVMSMIGAGFPKDSFLFKSRQKKLAKFLQRYSSMEELVRTLFSEKALKRSDIMLFVSWMFAQSELVLTVTSLGGLHVGKSSPSGKTLFSHSIKIFNPALEKITGLRI